MLCSLKFKLVSLLETMPFIYYVELSIFHFVVSRSPLPYFEGSKEFRVHLCFLPVEFDYSGTWRSLVYFKFVQYMDISQSLFVAHCRVAYCSSFEFRLVYRMRLETANSTDQQKVA